MAGVRRIATLGFAAAGLLLLPAATQARTVPLNWSERAPARGKPVMTFTVRAVVIERGSWAAVVSFTNRSRFRLSMVPASGILLYHSRTATHPYKQLAATAYRPHLTRQFAPGASWHGEFGGFGTVRDGDYVRVIMGSFTGKIPRPLGPRFSWITDHVYHYSEISGI
jgi:hypothetical protein